MVVALEKHSRLARHALTLKKAWLLAAAIIGAEHHLGAEERTIPNYSSWNNKALKKHIKDLEGDFDDIAKRILLHWKRNNLPSAVRWFAKQFDDWQQVQFKLFGLGRVHEVERQIGLLGHRRFMDCPPYAEVLLQGFHGAAIRHPEYHLARDLALLYSLFLDSEVIIDEQQRQRKRHSTEHSQSLARSVILTCFNLLESFVSGLAAAFVLDNPDTAEDVRKKLEDERLPLRKRLLLFPSLVTGRPELMDGSKPPFQKLFGECKQRRDSFVHCEPGPHPTKRGYVKEKHFHDVELAVVSETVDLTLETISLVWKEVHGKPPPSWLPKRDSTGRFERVDVVLRPTRPNRN
jgi:hypothetical protein